MKLIEIRHNRLFKTVRETSSEPVYIKSGLLDICQDDSIIANVRMERGKYRDYGCRVISLYRTAMYAVAKRNLPVMNVKKNDALLDRGGEFSDCWVDNYNSPTYDIIDAPRYVNRLNEVYDSNLKYRRFDRKELGPENFFKLLAEKIKDDIPLTIKMSGIFGGYHFVNVDGVIRLEDGRGFFHMVESYRKYKGYHNSWCFAGVPVYAEVIE